jgi:hypothetical protein
MRNRFVQIALSVVLLGLLIQIVLVAPSHIRDSETKASLMPTDLAARGAKLAHEEMGPSGTAQRAENTVDQSMKSMHMVETHEGGKEWELWSDRASSLKAKEVLELEGVKTIFYSD